MFGAIPFAFLNSFSASWGFVSLICKIPSAFALPSARAKPSAAFHLPEMNLPIMGAIPKLLR